MIAIILFALLVAVVSIPLHAYVATCLWGWFIGPMVGVPVISMALAYGIMLTIKFATYTLKPEDDNDDKKAEMIRICTQSIATPLFVLLFGYITQLFL